MSGEIICTCGHKPDFCHKVNAAKWCGAPADAARFQRLGQEIADRRACLSGAKQTLQMVEATLSNPDATDIEAIRHYLLVPLRQRLDLLDEAIHNGDEALSLTGWRTPVQPATEDAGQPSRETET